ncbi:hypothetical protein NDU88_003524 [Pleurodeles waltl]|uniref:Uncharacterized protein n=1 Tax=Pleurodeles waltl TaxID=8319 RepID=A0AAV7RF65_PLEWA|nr:hypothetical protein NDU88_003524 [Pleurodeles waltl]
MGAADGRSASATIEPRRCRAGGGADGEQQQWVALSLRPGASLVAPVRPSGALEGGVEKLGPLCPLRKRRPVGPEVGGVT